MMLKQKKKAWEDDFISSMHRFWPQFFFGWYVRLTLKTHFQSIDYTILGEGGLSTFPLTKTIDRGKSVLILCNHFGWWDSLLIYDWNRRFWGRQFQVMVLKTTLIKNKIFRSVGGFSVNPGNRSMLKSLSYSIACCAEDKNLLLLFPQGTMGSAQTEKIRFGAGIERIFRAIEDQNIDTQLILVAGFIDYFSTRKPQAMFYLRSVPRPNQNSTLEEIYQRFYAQARKVQGMRTS